MPVSLRQCLCGNLCSVLNPSPLRTLSRKSVRTGEQSDLTKTLLSINLKATGKIAKRGKKKVPADDKKRCKNFFKWTLKG